MPGGCPRGRRGSILGPPRAPFLASFWIIFVGVFVFVFGSVFVFEEVPSLLE